MELDRYLLTLSGEHGDGIEQALGWLVSHPDRSRLALVAILSADPRGLHVRHVLFALGNIGNPDDVERLREWLYKPTEGMIVSAAEALRVHPAPAAFDALVEATRSAQLAVVEDALRALGRRGDERARATLEAFLDHDDRILRIVAINALGDLGVEPSRARLEARQKVERDKDAKVRLVKVLGP